MSKITHINCTEVIVHAKEGYVDRPGFGPSIFDKGVKWLIEMRTDDGLIGYGETPRHTALGGVQWAAQQVIGKSLKGMSWKQPIPPNWAVHDALGHPNPPVPHRLYERDMGADGAAIGVGMAVQDLIAKAAGMRLVELFGGAHRESVRTDWWVGRTDAAHITQQMTIGMELGYNSIKIKAAAEDDIPAIVKAFKQVAGDDARMVIDPNTRFYRVSEAVRIAHSIEQYDNVVFEDPFPFDIAEWQLFRQKTSIPLVMHCTTSPHIALSNHCCDYVNLSYPAQKFLGDAHMAAHFGMLCWAGSGVELGLFNAYILHYCAATRICVLPGDAFGHQIREHGLINEPLDAVNGEIAVPTGPGLGVSFDPDAVKHYATNSWELKA